MTTATAAGRIDLERFAIERRPHSDPSAIDWTAPIDRTRVFVCDTIAPLCYTAAYQELSHEHRLRYNQLTGMFSNELILRLETGFLDGILESLARPASLDAAMCAAVARFRDDEREHAAVWRRLNRLSAPDWYDGTDHHFVRTPPLADVVGRFVARHPIACPLALWIQLSQEERSIDLSRRCLRLPADRIEPRYAAVYRAHLIDEVRHVRLDCSLIERFYASRSRSVRRMTAAIFRWILGTWFLKPVRSTVRVVSTLVAEYPELGPLLPRMTRELAELPRNQDYQQMMYSRKTTPLTFALFDTFREFHAMRRVLRAYSPAVPGGRS
jgi:hypothetical protein